MAALASSKYAALGGVPVGIAPAVGVSCGRSWMGMEALLSSYTIPEAGSRDVIMVSGPTMCPLHLSNGGSTILMLSSVMLKGYELLAYTTTGALGTGFRYS